MYVVCGEHLEQAIDEFVEVYEMPLIFTNWRRYHSRIGQRQTAALFVIVLPST